MAAQDRGGIGKRRRKLEQISRQAHRSHTLQAKRANRLQMEAGSGHKASFQTALGAHEDNFTRGVAGQPFARDGQRWNHVAARAASGD